MTVLVQTGPNTIASMSEAEFWAIVAAHAATFDWALATWPVRVQWRATTSDGCVFVRGFAADGDDTIDAGHSSSFAILMGVYLPGGDDPNPWRLVEALFDACNEVARSIDNGLGPF